MEILTQLEKQTQADVAELLSKVIQTAAEISSGILQVLSVPVSSPDAKDCLSDMRATGKLNNWIQALLDLTLTYKTQALNVLDDFRFLTGVSYSTSAVFEDLTEISKSLTAVDKTPSASDLSPLLSQWQALVDYARDSSLLVRPSSTKTAAMTASQIVESYGGQLSTAGHDYGAIDIDIDREKDEFAAEVVVGAGNGAPVVRNEEIDVSFGGDGQAAVSGSLAEETVEKGPKLQAEQTAAQDGASLNDSFFDNDGERPPVDNKDDADSLGSFGEEAAKPRTDSFDYFDDEEDKPEVKPQPKVEEKPIPKYKTVKDPALNKDLPPTELQTAIRLGRSIEPLEDQGRAFKPPKFPMPSQDTARKYMKDFTTTDIEVGDGKDKVNRRNHEIRCHGQWCLCLHY
jgi:hypothetical protein